MISGLERLRDAGRALFAAPKKSEAPKARVKGESAAAENSLTMSLGLENRDFLVSRKGLSIIDEMRLDDALGSFMDMKKGAALATEWEVVPASEDQADIDLADFVTYVFANLPGSFKERLRDILSAMEYGYSITNKPLVVLPAGPYAGKIGLLDLKTKEPHQFRFDVDEFRNVTGLLHTGPDYKVTKLDTTDFVLYSYRREFCNPYGTSDFTRCHRAWNFKKQIYKFWGVYLERFGGAWLDIAYDPDLKTDEDHAVAKKLVTDLQTRTGYLHPNGYEAKVQESSGRGHEAFKDSIREQNIYMARAVLIPDLLGFSERPGGAYSLGQKQFDLFLDGVIGEIQKDLSETVVQEQLIKPLVDLAQSNVEKYPTFQFKSFSEEDQIAICTMLLSAVEKGVLKPDLEMQNYVRRVAGLPEKDELELPEEKPAPEPAPDDVPDDKPNAVDEEELSARARKVFAFAKPKFSRPLTTFEKKINFERILATQDDLEAQITETWADLFKVARDDLVAQVKKRRIVEDEKEGEVASISLARREDMKKSLARFMLSSFFYGALEAQNEIASVRGEKYESPTAYQFQLEGKPLTDIEAEFAKKGLSMTPAIRQAAREIARRAFFVTGIETEKVLSRAKIIVMNGLSRKDVAWTEGELKKLFEGFISQGQITDKTLGELWRIGTVVRMQFNTAFNDGRRRKFDDPDVADFVVAYDWSAVLDDATTDYCAAMDKGGPYRKDDINREGWPPAHFNCRSIVVPITQGEAFELHDLPTREPRGEGFELAACCRGEA
jgi:phage gp29-like protein